MTTRFLTACAVGAILLGTAQVAAAECSNKSLDGAFGFSISGTNFNRNVQWAFVGRFVSDGNGTITGTGTHSVGGEISTGEFHAIYQVAPICTGSAAFTFGSSKATVRFVIVDDGKRLEMIVTDRGMLEIGSATKITTTKKITTTRRKATQ